MAEMMEAQEGLMDQSAEAYRRASTFYEADHDTQQANICLLKTASIYSIQEIYTKAVEMFSQVASDRNNLERFSSPRNLLCASVSMLADKNIKKDEASATLKDWMRRDPIFSRSKECRFVENLIRIRYETKNIHEFADHLYFFDSAEKFDIWELVMLGRIKDRVVGHDAKA